MNKRRKIQMETKKESKICNCQNGINLRQAGYPFEFRRNEKRVPIISRPKRNNTSSTNINSNPTSNIIACWNKCSI